MGPPGGGRNPVTPRLLRHFHYLTFLEMEEDSTVTELLLSITTLSLQIIIFQRKIFGTILQFWISKTRGLASYFDAVLSSTLVIYITILRELLPTPAKTHYTFNLRDLSKVFQGILMFIPESVKVSFKLYFRTRVLF